MPEVLTPVGHFYYQSESEMKPLSYLCVITSKIMIVLSLAAECLGVFLCVQTVAKV